MYYMYNISYEVGSKFTNFDSDFDSNLNDFSKINFC